MTAEELIAELSKLDPKTRIVLCDTSYFELETLTLGDMFNDNGRVFFRGHKTGYPDWEPAVFLE